MLARDIANFTESENYCREYFDLAQEHLKAYKMFSDVGDDWPYPHNVHTPDTFAFTEDAVAKNVQAFTGVEPMIAIKPRVGVDEIIEKIADQLERVLTVMLDLPEAEFFTEFESTQRSKSIFGTGYNTIEPVFKPGPMGDPVLDYITFEDADFWDIYPDPRADGINNRCRYIIRRKMLHRRKIIEAYERGFPYKNIDKVKTAEWGANLLDYHKDVLATVGLESYIPEDPEMVELLYFYEDGHVRILANRAFYILDSKDTQGVSPYVYGIPIVDFRFIPQSKEFFGVGIPWMLRDLQLNRNTLRSQRLTNVDLILSPPMKVRAGSEIDPNSLMLYPGAVIPMTNHDDVQWDAFPDTTASSYNEDNVIGLDMENVTALHRATRGISETKRQTGTEIIRLQQASLSRYDIMIKRDEMSMREIGRRCVVYIHQYMDPIEYQEILGEQDAGFFQLSLNEVLRRFRFIPVGSSVSSIKEVRAQRAAQAFQVVGSMPPQLMMQNLGGQKPFMVDYYEAMLGVLKASDMPNVDRILKLLQPQQPQQEQVGPAQDPRMAQILQQIGQG